jgi:BRCT domain type II-containing protein
MSLDDTTIVFTGTLTTKRADATRQAREAGATVTDAVSGKTDILVAGPGSGAKMADAQSKGVEVWTEEQFLAACSGTGGDSDGKKRKAPAKKALAVKKKPAPAKKEPAPKKKPAAKKGKAAAAEATKRQVSQYLFQMIMG